MYIRKYRKKPNPAYLQRLFINQRGHSLTRHGIHRLCKKYLQMAITENRLKSFREDPGQLKQLAVKPLHGMSSKGVFVSQDLAVVVLVVDAMDGAAALALNIVAPETRAAIAAGTSVKSTNGSVRVESATDHNADSNADAQTDAGRDSTPSSKTQFPFGRRSTGLCFTNHCELGSRQ